MAYFFTNEILFWALVVVGVVAITDAVWLFFITK